MSSSVMITISLMFVVNIYIEKIIGVTVYNEYNGKSNLTAKA